MLGSNDIKVRYGKSAEQIADSITALTRDMKKTMKFTDNLECGSVVINGSSYFRSFEMPFGGFKYSGIGSEGVFSTFDELTQLKCITLKGIGNY